MSPVNSATSLTKDRMLRIEAASVVSGEVDNSGDLILKTFDGTTINAGHVKGARGEPGPEGGGGGGGSGPSAPEGSIMIFAGAAAPDGWLLCDGRQLRKSDYPNLAGVIGNIYGTPSDSAYFQLPNLKGRFVMQKESETLGTTGGAKTHTLTADEMPAHTHTQDAHTHTSPGHTHYMLPHSHAVGQHSHTQVDHTHYVPPHTHSTTAHSHTQASHAHPVTFGQGGGSTGSKITYKDSTNYVGVDTPTHSVTPSINTAGVTVQSSTLSMNASGSNIQSASVSLTSSSGNTDSTTTTNDSTTATNQSTGGGVAHNNMPPYIAMNYIIKT